MGGHDHRIDRARGGSTSVPGPHASWRPTVEAFADAFDVFELVGSLDQVGSTGSAAIEAFATDGSLPETVVGLRTCLAFEAHRWRYLESDPSTDAMTWCYIQAMLARLAECMGGSVG